MYSKPSSIFPIILIIVFTFYWGCNKESEIPSSEITDVSITNDGCKSSKSALLTEEYTNNVSCLKYEYDSENKKISFSHINAGFNCCPGEIKCNISMAGDTIIIQEYEESAQCHCNCLYDLNIELSTIEANKYVVKVDEPYGGEQEELIFRIDLIKNKNGEFCVTRENYPWGI